MGRAYKAVGRSVWGEQQTWSCLTLARQRRAFVAHPQTLTLQWLGEYLGKLLALGIPIPALPHHPAGLWSSTPRASFFNPDPSAHPSPTPPPRRSVVEQYLGKRFEAFKPMPEWRFEDYLGWHEQVGVWGVGGEVGG